MHFIHFEDDQITFKDKFVTCGSGQFGEMKLVHLKALDIAAAAKAYHSFCYIETFTLFFYKNQ